MLQKTQQIFKMSLQHFFLENQILNDEITSSKDGSFKLNLGSDDFHHAKVLRLKPGEHIGVIDSSSNFYECEIIEFEQSLIVKNCCHKSNSTNHQICLCPGISKANKLDDVIRSCSEIGVDSFIPVDFERSISKLDEKKEDKKIERWNKIAKSAAMQSGQYRIPKIYQSVDVEGLCAQLKDFDCVFVCWEEAESKDDILDVCGKFKNSKENKNIAIVIGPEGGITENEINAFKSCNNNAYVVSIGNSILRTETAGIVASAIIKFLSC